jgi:hypothetical protein
MGSAFSSALSAHLVIDEQEERPIGPLGTWVVFSLYLVGRYCLEVCFIAVSF